MHIAVDNFLIFYLRNISNHSKSKVQGDLKTLNEIFITNTSDKNIEMKYA